MALSTINFVILHYKEFELTVKCVDSIIDTVANSTIYIVDNHSADGSLERLESSFSSNNNIHFIPLDQNYGFAKANNMAMKLLLHQGERYAILVNNDVVFQKWGALLEVLTFSANSHIIAVPKVYKPDGSIWNTVQLFSPKSCMGYFTKRLYERFLRSEKNYAQLLKKSTEISEFSGCCFACDLVLMDKIGYMDETTFMYFEEPILAAKVRENHLKILYVPNTEVIHYHGMTSRKNNVLTSYYRLESQAYYLRKYLKGNRLILHLFIWYRRFLDWKRIGSTELYNLETKLLEIYGTRFLK